MIVIASVIVAVSLSNDLTEKNMILINSLKYFCSAFFLFEIFIRFFGRTIMDVNSYFEEKSFEFIHYFELIIIIWSLLPIPYANNIIILRLFRLLAIQEVTRLVPKLSIRNISLMKFTAIRIVYIGTVLGVVSFIYAIAGVNLFSNTHPEHWGNLGNAMFSLTGILLGEATVNRYLMPLQEVYWWAWIYIWSYTILGALIILNLLLAVIVDMLGSRSSRVNYNKKE